METPHRLTSEAEGDPQRTLVLIGLGYGALVVIAVYLDFKYQMWRSRRRREKREGSSKEDSASFRKGRKKDDEHD